MEKGDRRFGFSVIGGRDEGFPSCIDEITPGLLNLLFILFSGLLAHLPSACIALFKGIGILHRQNLQLLVFCIL